MEHKITSSHILCILFGICLGLLYQTYINYITVKKYDDKKTKLFILIKEALYSGIVIFKERINNLVYLSCNDIIFVYKIDKSEIFKDNECVAISSKLDENLIKDIINMININFKEEIDDIVSINGYFISKGLHNSPIVTVYDLDLDDILDRINKVGYDKLTTHEKDFLSKLK
jgi:hypothetical protein